MSKYIIDRFVGEMVVLELENGETIDVSKNKIPIQAEEGDVLIESNDMYTIDKDATKKLKEEVEELMAKLFVD
jgi:hypothetical protein